MVHIITYDLHNPGRDYAKIEAAIVRLADSWKHPQGSVWFVDSQLDPEYWRDALKDAGDPNDEFFVCRLAWNWASSRLDADAAAWLKHPGRTW